MKMRFPLMIISGGQTGVDQAALKAAAMAGLSTGGWCPPGRVCESGKIPEEYPLRETKRERSEYALDVPRSLRTERNVRDADAVLILLTLELASDPGTQWARDCAALFRKPLLVADPYDDSNHEMILRWIRAIQPKTLNVAGPAESKWPGINMQTYSLLLKVFSDLKEE